MPLVEETALYKAREAMIYIRIKCLKKRKGKPLESEGQLKFA